MDYENALNFYLQAIPFSHPPTLELMKELCRNLGDPQKDLPCVHIAGTNGKGSCAAMLCSVFQAAGLKTGLYTSPHLVDFRERIQINGVYIKQESVAALTPRVMEGAAALDHVSFFELVTALAFLYFKQEQCDIVVLECGLGGRFDATNTISDCLCSVMMPMALDHTPVLGDRLEQIAWEKTGILKPGRPVVSAAQPAEAAAVIADSCRDVGSPLHLVDITKIFPVSSSPEGQQFHYKNLKNIRLSLLGRHQRENAAAVIECAALLGLKEDALRRGLAGARWPCRFEVLRQNPPFVIDAAHNPHGARALADGLREHFPGQRFCFILGVMADKNWPELLPVLEPLAAQFLCVAPESPRALPPDVLAARIRSVPARACQSLEEALALARRSALPCCACGSLYFIGYLRQLLRP